MQPNKHKANRGLPRSRDLGCTVVCTASSQCWAWLLLLLLSSHPCRVKQVFGGRLVWLARGRSLGTPANEVVDPRALGGNFDWAGLQRAKCSGPHRVIKPPLCPRSSTPMDRPSLDDPLSHILAPPPNESPLACQTRIRAEADARRVSDAIDEQLRSERAALKKKRRPVKLLILGQSESGASILPAVPSAHRSP